MSNHREETIHRLAIEGWSLVAIQKLLRAAKKAQRAATYECNGPPDHIRDEHATRAWVNWCAIYSNNAARAVELACTGQPHLGYRIDGDPRGYVVKLMLKSGAYNTFGGAESGWGVPA
jgi:hypothetical protein